MNNMVADISFAWRALWARPMYASITIVVLALAIGANATVFSVFSGFFLKPLPYPDDERLVVVYNTYPKMALEFAGTSIPDYLDRREHAGSLEDIGMFTSTRRTLGVEGAPEQVTVVRATPSLFSTLGVAPHLGRVFTDDEAVQGNDRVVVLSHQLWSTRFGARRDIVGDDIRLNGESFRVVGVMPEGFGYPNREVRGYVPFTWSPDEASDNARGHEYSGSIGRLKPGATIEGLNAEMDTIVQRTVERIPGAAAFLEQSGFTGRARPLRDFAVGDLRQMLLLLQGIVVAVLLIACANVANLQLARMAARRKELSLRAALGAYRRRLVGLVLTESLVLSGLGAAAGLVVALGGLALVRQLGLDKASQGFEFALDPTVLLVTGGAAVLAGLLSAVLPIYMLMRDNLARAIQDAGRLGGGGTAAQGLRSTLVVVQITVSVALLVGAGLLTKSFYQLQQQGAGFDASSLLTARVSLPQNRYPDEAAQQRFLELALGELNALPGVVEAGFTNVLPMSGSNSQGSFVIDGYTPPEGVASPHAQQRTIDERYLRTMDIPVVFGRNFARLETDRVTIIDENLANRYWPEGNALGQRVRRAIDGDDEWYTVVGIVPAIKQFSLVEDATKETIYWHYLQRGAGSGVFTLKTGLPPEQVARVARNAVLAIDPELPLFDMVPMATRVSDALGPQRTPMVLTLVFAGVALVLAVVGIYGVLTWAVTQRVGELGVRLALGARRQDIVKLVVGQGGRLTVIGLVIGAIAAIALGQAMSSQIHGVSALDPLVFGIVITGLALSALLASWIPARRAGRIDPMTALRNE